jgi:hypothetical protein
MKITKAERACFKEALEGFNESSYNHLCILISNTSATTEVKEKCKALLFHYFNDRPGFQVIWLNYQDKLTIEEANTCRLIALYTLIYAPL